MGEHIGQTCENEEEIMDDLDEWFVKESDSKDKGEEDCDFYGAKFSYEEYVPGSAVSRWWWWWCSLSSLIATTL